MRLSQNLITLAAYAVAALLALLAASWAATAIESRSATAVRQSLVESGYIWTSVHADGLQVVLTGTAPSESQRFRALSAAGEVVDPGRVVDGMEVDDPDTLEAPDFSVEILRNSDGISLIGLVPADTDRDAIVADLGAMVGEGTVTDLLDTADHPVPATWETALAFGLIALERLPRAKVSVTATRVAVTAISDSLADKARLEADLSREAPDGLALILDISAPRPVIAPFTLRFLIGDGGARFDACSASNEPARDRILAAAAAAGATGKLSCTIGLGVPSPEWPDAVEMAIAALNDLGAGSVTFSDADVTLVAAETVSQADFDRVVGELESNLPDVFALEAVLTPKSDGGTSDGVPEFSAVLSEGGKVVLRGRINDDRSRAAVENVARAAFGGDAVNAAMRLDESLPQGWPVRVLAAVEALAEIDQGSVSVKPDLIRIEGVTGSQDTSATVTGLLSRQLGGAEGLEINVRYDRKLDPLLGLPTPQQCVDTLNTILAAHKVTFEPGSATIAPDARDTLDKLAAAMKNCDEVPMEVGGHTDSQGREEMNLELSQNRAQAIIDALMERRILVGSLTAQGYGETIPVGDNQTETGREANRRIEITLITPPLTPTVGTSSGEPGAEETAAAVPVVVETPGENTIKPRQRPER